MRVFNKLLSIRFIISVWSWWLPLTSCSCMQVSHPPHCLQQRLCFIFQSVLTTDCDWHLTNTPTSHLNAQMNESYLILQAFQNSSGLFTLLVLLIIIIIFIRMATAASIRPLFSLNSYSSHWSHHDIGPLPNIDIDVIVSLTLWILLSKKNHLLGF